jgi:hypothetical protein
MSSVSERKKAGEPKKDKPESKLKKEEPKPTPDRAASGGPSMMATLIVVGISIACYYNSLQGEFAFDDHGIITENADVSGGSSMVTLFQNDFWGKNLWHSSSHKSWRPITVLTFRLNYELHGLSVFGYHLVNVLLHAFNSYLLLLVCRRCFGSGASISSSAATASAAAAALFAAHPVHTEAVAGLAGRAELLMAAFRYVRAKPSKR